MRGPWPVALLVMLVLPGCLSSGDEPETPAEANEATPGIVAHAPMWNVGDWWRLSVEDPITGSTFNVTQVVAAVTADHYIVGFPIDAWSEEALILHIPPFGEIRRDDLGWEVHDEPFHPLRFPLEDGDTWETRFEGLDMHAEVAFTHGDHHATVHFTGGIRFLIGIDTATNAITRFKSPDYASYEVVERGTGWVGPVVAPLGADLVFLNGRIAGALDIRLQPAAPIETVTVPEEYDRLTFALLLGTLVPPQGPQGIYREKVTDPHGQTYEFMALPTARPGLLASIHAVDDPAGTWTFEHLALGPGVAAVEGIAYRTATYDL